MILETSTISWISNILKATSRREELSKCREIHNIKCNSSRIYVNVFNEEVRKRAFASRSPLEPYPKIIIYHRVAHSINPPYAPHRSKLDTFWETWQTVTKNEPPSAGE